MPGMSEYLQQNGIFVRVPSRNILCICRQALPVRTLAAEAAVVVRPTQRSHRTAGLLQRRPARLQRPHHFDCFVAQPPRLGVQEGIHVEVEFGGGRIRSQRRLGARGVSVQPQCDGGRALSEELDELRVVEGVAFDTVGRDQLIPRPYPTVRYGGLLNL